jgi:hypothetical protein
MKKPLNISTYPGEPEMFNDDWAQAADFFVHWRGDGFKVENLWWPGSFRLDSPREFDYPHCGITLATGHLLDKNPHHVVFEFTYSSKEQWE